jgi:hypothetical protein
MKVFAPDPTPYLGTLANLLAYVRPFEMQTNGSCQPDSCQTGSSQPGVAWNTMLDIRGGSWSAYREKAKSMAKGFLAARQLSVL